MQHNDSVRHLSQLKKVNLSSQEIGSIDVNDNEDNYLFKAHHAPGFDAGDAQNLNNASYVSRGRIRGGSHLKTKGAAVPKAKSISTDAR